MCCITLSTDVSHAIAIFAVVVALVFNGTPPSSPVSCLCLTLTPIRPYCLAILQCGASSSLSATGASLARSDQNVPARANPTHPSMSRFATGLLNLESDSIERSPYACSSLDQHLYLASCESGVQPLSALT